jgi:heat shock protein HslJ
MACLEEELNRQEQAFLAALRDTERHEIAGDTLRLVGPAGVLVRLVARPK